MTFVTGWQLRDIRRNPPRLICWPQFAAPRRDLVAREQLGC
jgi:hypothetical protein